MKIRWSYIQKILIFLIIFTVSISGFHIEIKKENNEVKIEPKLVNPVKATYQFTPTGGQLVTGTAQTIVSATASDPEGVNTGSWKGTLGDDDFHWSIASTSSGYNAQIVVGGVELNGANTIMLQSEFDLDATAPSTLIQICDWVTSTSVDNAADSQCTTGGWRTLNNTKTGITTTTPTAYHWQIYDGYWTNGSNTPISTPLTNFINGSNEIRVRYFSTTNTTSVVSIDFLRVFAVINSVYSAASSTNLGSGGITGEYTNTTVVTQGASDNTRFQVAGTAGSVADMYFSFKNVKTYNGMNTVLIRAEYSCSAAGINHRPKIYNFNSSSWEDLTSASIACSTTDVTSFWAKNNVTISNYISNGEVRIGWRGLSNSTTALRFDQIYIMLGSTNTNSSACEITFGTNSAGSCADTRDLDGNTTANTWQILTEDESNTLSHDFYSQDIVSNATIEESGAATVEMPINPSSNMAVTGLLYATRQMSGVAGTVAVTPRYYGNQFSTGSGGGFLYIATSGTASLNYNDNIINGSQSWGGPAGGQFSAVSQVDSVNGKFQLHLGTSAGGATSNNSINQWDFAMLSIQWIEDANHPSASWQFNPTGSQLVTGTSQNILAATVASTEGANLGSWRGTLTNDDFHWSVASTSSGYDMQLTYDGVELNGANMMMINTEFDLDATAPDTVVQICDWESSSSVDNAADSQCTGGGWRTVNNRKVPINTTTPSTYTFLIYDGYWSNGSNTPVSTPLTNFVKSTNEVRIRLYSTTNTTSVVSIDYMTVVAVVNPLYLPAGITNLGTGATTGDYTSVNNIYSGGSDDTRVEVAGTAGSVADMYFSYKNIKTFTGMNTIYMRAELGCSGTGISFKPKVYNFNTSSWEDFQSYSIACGTADNTRVFAKNNITISNYISNGEMRIGWYGLSNSTISIRIDLSYVILGATNTDSADCEISFGTLSAGDCTKTRDYNQNVVDAWDIATEDESNTFGHDYYALDNDADAVVEEAGAAHLKIAVTLPAYSAMTNVYTAQGLKSGPSPGIVSITIRDYSGVIGNQGGFTTMGISGGTTGNSIFDNIQSASYLGSLVSNGEDFIDTVNNKISLRLRTSTSGATTNNAINQWDFAMVSPQWTETKPTYSQSAFRFFNNANSTDVGSALATQDTAASLGSVGAAFRLRMLMHLNNDDLRISKNNFKLQYVAKGGGSCASPSGGTPSSYTDVTGSTLIAFNDNATPTNGSALTSNANDPTHNSDKIRPQTYIESNNFTNSQKILNSGQDGLWDFSLKDNGAAEGTDYCFRVVESDGTTFSSYPVYPKITTAATTVTLSISDNTIGFGSLLSSAARWATGDTLGSGTSTSAHTITASTSSSAGYTLYVQGDTLTSRAPIQPNSVSGLLLWLKPESLYLNDGDPISTWPDSSGNYNTASATGSERPTYKTSIVNGKAVARFDGLDDYLTLTTGLTTVRTAILVIKWTAGGAAWVPVLGSSSVYDFHGDSPGDAQYFSTLYTSSSVLSGSTFDNGIYSQPSSLTKNLSNFRVIEIQTTGNTSVDQISKDRSIAGRVIKGDIAEVMLYNSVISSADRVGIESYLSAKYGLSFASGPYVISAIGGSAVASNPGTEQFGLRLTSSGGSGVAVSPYNTSNFAYAASGSTQDDIGQATTSSTDTYTTYYLGNISTTTKSGSYSSNLTYTIVGNF